MRSLALAVFGMGALPALAPAFAQGPNVTALSSRPEPAGPAAVLPSPPPGPIESRMLAIPLREIASAPAPALSPASFGGALPVIIVTDRRKSKGRSPAAPSGTGSETGLVITINPAPFGLPTPPPDEESAPPSKPALAALAPDLGPTTPPPTKAPLAASVPFAGPSPNLTDTTRALLDRVGEDLAAKKPRLVEVRAFATGDDITSRQISLARALVVRAYLIDRGVKSSRIDIGAFLGDDERVDILVPNK